MKIDLDLINCQKCGIYLNSKIAIKGILTLKNKEDWVYIYGFSCPVCETLHFKLPDKYYLMEKIAKADEDFKGSKYFSIKEYIAFKLNIPYKYGENIMEIEEEEE